MRPLLALIGTLGLLLAVLLLIGTFSRYLDIRAFFGIDEITILIAVWFYFIGVAVTSWRRSHIEGGLVQGLAGPRLRRWFDLLGLVVTLAVLAAFAYGAVAYVIELVESDRRSSYFRLPSSLWAAALAAGLLLSVACYLLHLVRHFRRGSASAEELPGQR